MPTKQTATELYNQRREDIARVLDWIDLDLTQHQADADASPDDWSNAGDLGHVLDLLTNALAFLSNREPQEITTLLSECR